MDRHKQNVSTYQLAGVDERKRGFSRQVEISCRNGRFHALLRYETLSIQTDSFDTDDTEEAALQRVIQILQDQGYTLLRTQLIFRGDQYLGSREMWVEYPDPIHKLQSGLIGWIKTLWGKMARS